MKTKMNPAMGGGASTSKKLMAAIAVLAVAFVVFAAIPAVDTDGANPTEITDFNGFTDALTKGGNYVLKDNINGIISEAKTVTTNVSFDLNGKTIDLTGGQFITASGCTLEFKSTDKVGTLKYNGFSSTADAALSADANGILTLDNIKFETDGSAVFPYGNASKATIKYSEIVAGAYAVGTNNAKTGNNELSIEIENSTLTTNGKVKDNATVMINAQNVTLSIKNSTLTGDRQTLFVRAGTATVENTQINFNDAFTGTINAAEGKWGSGNEVASAAVVVGDKGCDDAYAGTAKLTLKGGEIKATSGAAVVTSTDANTGYELIIGNETATKVSIGSNSVSITGLKAVETGFSISEGSVVITGSMTATDANSKIAQAEGDVVLKDLTITTGTLTIDKTVGVEGNLNVASGATLNVASGATLNVADKATLSVAGTVSGTITNNGTVEKVNGGNLNGATINGGKTTERTDDSNKENINIDGTIKGTENTYDADQIVTINGDTKIVEGAVLTINGTLVVKEGVTLTLEAGSRLVIADNAVMDIQGTVVVEESYGVVGETGYVAPAEFEIRGNVAVYGALNVNGTVTFVTGTVSVEQDGVVDILEEGKIAGTPAAYKFVVKASGTLNVAGSITTMDIENNGTVTFDSKVESGKVTVDMKNGAVLDVKNITLAKGGFIELNDGKNTAKLSATAAGTKASGGTEITDNAGVKAVISGISVSETVTSKTENNVVTNTYVMTVSGSAAVSPIHLGTDEEPSNMVATATVELNGFATTSTAKSKLTIAEGLTVGENVTLENKGTLEVTVVVDATKGTVNNTGKITVSGSGSIITKQTAISDDANINASKYSVAGTTDSDKTYYYVTLDNALAAAATGTTKDITVLGKQTLAASAELVSGATLNIDGATLVIGSGEKDSDVVLTVKSGATVKGTPVADSETEKAIDVKGTVSAENKRDIKTGVTDALNAGAAVYSEQMDDRNRPVSNGWAKWTNVYTAMADSTLTVVKLINGITLDKSLTIPEGKTLDTDGENVRALKNVVITVEGTLDIGSPSQIYLEKPAATETADKTASIVVKGLIQSDAAIANNSIMEVEHTTPASVTGTAITLLGAYYTVDGTNCMTTVEKAAAIISTVDGQEVTIKGETADKLTVAGDIAFAGKSADEPATVKVEISEIAFSGSVSIDNAVIKFVAAAKVSGTFANASGSVALKGQTVAQSETENKALSVASVTKDGTAVLTVSGKLSKISDDVKQVFTVTGAVTVNGITLDNATVDGTMTVKGNSTVSKNLKINGIVSITAGAKLTASDEATVLGTVTAAPATTSPVASAGEFSAKKLYVGTTKDAVGAAASVTGSVVLNDAGDAGAFAIVAAGSTVDAFTAEGSTFKSTAYYVDNGLFVTVYANETNEIEINGIKAEKDNAWFSAWKNEKGEPALDATPRTPATCIGDVGFTMVTADFITEIFSVVVNADTAVDNLYIDGNLMTKNGTQFTLVGSKLVAGNHTFSYTLKNGYSGEGTFKVIGQKTVVDDEATSVDITSSVSGNTLTLAGIPTSDKGVIVELQLTGFTASGYVDPTPIAPSEDKDDGLTVTDYLLIILVVLIVIMAVIVAMRLMRS